MKKLFITFSFLMITLLCIAPAYANHISGYLYCDVNGDRSIDPSDTPLAGIKIHVQSWAWYNKYDVTTDDKGFYFIPLLGPDGTHTLTIVDLPAGSTVVLPGGNSFVFDTKSNPYVKLNGLIDSPTCRTSTSGACWMTAGGVKFDPTLMIPAAEKGPKFNFGGNTFPGCSPTAGDGGQWSFVDRLQKIHFQAWEIDKVTCGNVPGIPEGSTSPKTPFNYIEFSGWGTIKSIAGNGASSKSTTVADTPQKVYFWARFEDRNEPGNLNALPNEGAKVDRLYLRVYTDTGNPFGSIVYLINGDVDPANVVPVLITGGNIQIHISSCF